MASYYIDSVAGDNANDGLTPGAALADIFGSKGTTLDRATFWVKRGSVFEIDAVKDIDNVDVIAWPKSTDSWYGDRPQLGIDDNWDNDLIPSPIIRATVADIDWMNLPTVDSSSVGFKGMLFDCDIAVSGDIFKLQSARIIMDYCKVYGKNHNMRLFKYVAGLSDKQLDNGVVEFNNSVYINENESNINGIFYYLNGTDDTNYKKHLYLNHSEIYNVGNLVHARRDGYSRSVDIFIDDTTITTSDVSFEINVNKDRVNYFYFKIHIDNSSISSNSHIFRAGNGTYYYLCK